MGSRTKRNLRIGTRGFASEPQKPQPGDADGDVGDEVEQAEDCAEAPEIPSRNIAATVVNG